MKTMDIPNTGAVFTLGKSHLAENTQSYFYIKNDPVRRLTSGAKQSAVICESGRLFVWGENYHGELGVGANSSTHSNIITKPTCVKSLKTLGLKIADVAFGHNWAVILTHSNEVFFTGQTIFPAGTKVTDNFTSATIGAKTCSIIRKPFRLMDFDNCLSTSEDQENFTSISAGNAHFAVMTSFGRLIGWGSNNLHQLGSDNLELIEPHEIILESKVKSFVCGPTSTLILTENGNLYLTGRLSEFACTQFTELQKNLSPQEEILFMHISKASEIYIVTNEGGIYRSIESMRHSSLIFQRFYDYDSEENGQIVKLLRGTSFYAALTKANKFYTTFSESGHHLKTFREISKFKNLRTMDMAVGDQHILVHGIPRTANKHLNKTFVKNPDSNANISQVPDVGRIVEGKISEEAEEVNQNGNIDETIKPNTPEHVSVQDNQVEVTAMQATENNTEENHEMANVKDHSNGNPPTSAHSSNDKDTLEDSSPTASLKSAQYHKLDESEIESNTSTASKKTVLTANADNSSPSLSIKSRSGSARSIRFDENALKNHNSSDPIVRQKTPYPDEDDSLDKTSPAFDDSLEYIPEPVATFQSENQQRSDSSKSRASTKKRKLTPIHRNADPLITSEEDEQLTVEISSTDFLDKTVVNEIRFINNGIDVTEKIAENLPTKIESAAGAVEDEVTKDLTNVNESVHAMADDVKKSAIEEADNMADNVAGKIDEASSEAETTFGKVKSNVNAAVAKVSTEVDSAVSKVSTKFDSAVSSISEGVDNTMTSVSNTVNTTVTKISSKVDDAKHNISNLFTGDNKDDTPNRSSNASTAMTTEEISTPKDDDERTTASVNSTGTGNPFDNDSEQKLSTMKHSLENDIRLSDSGTGKMKQFLSDMKARGKGMSCRDDKAIRVEDDPPKYTPVDQYADQSDKTSKVCTIL